MKPLLPVLLLLFLATGAQGQSVLNRGNGAEPDTLDPAFASSTAEINILGDLMVGLTTLDAAARPMPGIADHWETARDGLTWTFHLRPAHWSDGSKITAPDFVAAWRRLLDPKTAARAAQTLWIIRNAQAITAGHMPPSSLGARAPDAATVVIALERPAPYLPELLTQPAALPLPQAALKISPQPGAYVSDGPYRLLSWVPNDHVSLVKNPAFYDAATVKIDAVNYFPTADTEAALRRLRAGELDMQTPLPSAQLAWLRANMPGALHIMPSLALAYVAINLRDPALADIRVRRALNLIYDREAVAQKVMKLNERPAYAFVPPNMANYAGGPELDFKAMPYPARLALARKLMQDAGFGPFNKLTLAYATTGNPDSKRLAAVFQAMARQIYVDLRINISDHALELRALRQGQYQLGYATWFADFDDASDFLDLLKSGNPGNYAGYKNPKFDAALETAEREPDAGKRALLLKSAERIALADLPWVPIRFLSQSEAVAPRVGGYMPNARDYNRSRWLWIKKIGH
ncbi:MAG TPA: peptide ABC transporter substrate-binding protein [Rhizomicrobium sp.]|jgi:oligopeptide transport system substrate-binding protein